MAYEIIFQDRTSTIVGKDDGEKIKELLLKAKTPQPLEINGEFYKSNMISAIKHASNPTVESPNWDLVTLDEGNKCRGERSIARELMRIANKTKDFKLLGDPAWREEQTKKLLAKSNKWCDGKTGKCACDSKL